MGILILRIVLPDGTGVLSIKIDHTLEESSIFLEYGDRLVRLVISHLIHTKGVHAALKLAARDILKRFFFGTSLCQGDLHRGGGGIDWIRTGECVLPCLIKDARLCQAIGFQAEGGFLLLPGRGCA